MRLVLTLKLTRQFSQTTGIRSGSDQAPAVAHVDGAPAGIKLGCSTSTPTKTWPHCLHVTKLPRCFRRIFNRVEQREQIAMNRDSESVMEEALRCAMYWLSITI